jgi:GvpD gas vesicle protein
MLFRKKAQPAPPPRFPWAALADPPRGFSTGIPALDATLGGGYLAGGIITVTAGPGAADEDFLLLALPVIANFLSVGRGATVVPPMGVSAPEIRENLTRCLPVPEFESRVRVFDYSWVSLDETWRVPMARFGRVEAVRAMVAAERAMGTLPYVGVTALEPLERATNPTERVNLLISGLSRVRDSGGLAVNWVTTGSNAGPTLTRMADVELRLSRVSGNPVVEGVRPAWPGRSISWSEPKGSLRVELGLA